MKDGTRLPIAYHAALEKGEKKNGELVDQSIGFKPEPAITGWIESHL